MRILKGLHDRVIEFSVVFKRDMQYIARLKSTKPIVAYVGWVGYGNLGDELLFEAHEALFPEFALIPCQKKSLLGFILRRKKGLARACILGGGTLISLPGDWLPNVKYLLSLRLPTFAIGTGVNFTFDAKRTPVAYPNLGDWVKTLDQFNYVGLRGPLSAQTIATAIGGAHQFEVIGDTAMALAPAVMPAAPQEKVRTIGVCIGHSKDIPVPVDPEQYLAECVAFVKKMIGRGLNVKLLPVWGKDVAFNQALVDAVADEHCSLVLAYEHSEDYLREVSECVAFVGQKLHGTVMAIMMRVPSLMVAYHPKCFDFMESIDMGQHCVSMDGLDAGKLEQQCLTLIEDAVQIRNELDISMRAHRSALRKKADTLSHLVTSQV